MGFHSNVTVSKVVGVITATLALVAIAAPFAIGKVAPLQFVLPVGIASAIVSAVAFSYRRSVTIDSRRMLVETTRRILFRMDTRHFGFQDFQAVGVTPPARGDSQNRPPMYFVQLVGPINLVVPGKSANYERMHSRARRISEV